MAVEQKKAEQKQENPQVNPLEGQIALLQQKLSQVERERAEEKAKIELERQRMVEEQESQKRKELEEKSSLRSLMQEQEEEPEQRVTREQQIEMMSNRQLLDIIADAVDTAIGSKVQLVEKSFEDKQKDLVNSIEALKKEVITTRAVGEVERASKAFPDFDEYRKDISEVIKTYPGMDIGHAYLLAKSIRSLQATSRSETETERPTREATRSMENFEGVREEHRRLRERQEQGPTAGLKGFREILNKALDKTIKS